MSIPFVETLTTALPIHQPRPIDAPAALAGIRVIDFTYFVAAPLATILLADLGADVIKVEMPERGDELPYYPPMVPGIGDQRAPYVWANRNKRSIGLNVKNAAIMRVEGALTPLTPALSTTNNVTSHPEEAERR